eukprot:gene57269-76466_t
MVIDTTATPLMAQELIRHIRSVTDLPIKYVTLTHYHAVRVLGASAYFQEGGEQIIASRGTYEMIVERGAQDMQSEIERFPRLFAGVESVPGLTWPTMVFEKELTVFMGKLEVKIMHVGMGHTKGDTVAWLPQEKIRFSGDLVEFDATPYAGDAYFQDWPQTLDNIAALKPEKLVPGRGAALQTPEQVQAVLAHCRRHGIWVLSDEVYERLVYDPAQRSAPSFLAAADEGDRVMAVNSFSKAWSMTGWRAGWVAAP